MGAVSSTAGTARGTKRRRTKSVREDDVVVLSPADVREDRRPASVDLTAGDEPSQNHAARCAPTQHCRDIESNSRKRRRRRGFCGLGLCQVVDLTGRVRTLTSSSLKGSTGSESSIGGTRDEAIDLCSSSDDSEGGGSKATTGEPEKKAVISPPSTPSSQATTGEPERKAGIPPPSTPSSKATTGEPEKKAVISPPSTPSSQATTGEPENKAVISPSSTLSSKATTGEPEKKAVISPPSTPNGRMVEECRAFDEVGAPLAIDSVVQDASVKQESSAPIFIPATASTIPVPSTTSTPSKAMPSPPQWEACRPGHSLSDDHKLISGALPTTVWPSSPADALGEGRENSSPASTTRKEALGSRLGSSLMWSVNYQPFEVMLMIDEMVARGMLPPRGFGEAVVSALLKSRCELRTESLRRLLRTLLEADSRCWCPSGGPAWLEAVMLALSGGESKNRRPLTCAALDAHVAVLEAVLVFLQADQSSGGEKLQTLFVWSAGRNQGQICAQNAQRAVAKSATWVARVWMARLSDSDAGCGESRSRGSIPRKSNVAAFMVTARLLAKVVEACGLPTQISCETIRDELHSEMGLKVAEGSRVCSFGTQATMDPSRVRLMANAYLYRDLVGAFCGRKSCPTLAGVFLADMGQGFVGVEEDKIKYFLVRQSSTADRALGIMARFAGDIER